MFRVSFRVPPRMPRRRSIAPLIEPLNLNKIKPSSRWHRPILNHYMRVHIMKSSLYMTVWLNIKCHFHLYDLLFPKLFDHDHSNSWQVIYKFFLSETFLSHFSYFLLFFHFACTVGNFSVFKRGRLEICTDFRGLKRKKFVAIKLLCQSSKEKKKRALLHVVSNIGAKFKPHYLKTEKMPKIATRWKCDFKSFLKIQK